MVEEGRFCAEMSLNIFFKLTGLIKMKNVPLSEIPSFIAAALNEHDNELAAEKERHAAFPIFAAACKNAGIEVKPGDFRYCFRCRPPATYRRPVKFCCRRYSRRQATSPGRIIKK